MFIAPLFSRSTRYRKAGLRRVAEKIFKISGIVLPSVFRGRDYLRKQTRFHFKWPAFRSLEEKQEVHFRRV